MRLRWVGLVVALALAAGAAAGLTTLRHQSQAPVDIVTYNDVVESLKEEPGWPPTTLPDADGAGYVLFAPDDTVLGATGDDGLPTCLFDAYRHRDTVMPVVRDGRLAAMVAFGSSDDSTDDLTWLRWAVVGPLLGVGVLIAGVLWYLHSRVLRPFAQMQDFASRVAAGDLDAPLQMDRANTFGAFTESFDLMRSELAAARDRERAANLSKKELVASLSHDLKTPVASIRAMAEFLTEHLAQAGPSCAPPDPTTRDGLAQITAKTDQIGALVANLFAATLAEAEHLEVNPVPVPSSLVADLLRTADVHHRIDWSHPDAQVPTCLVRADLMRLAQVVDNVVANSDKYAGTPMTVRYGLVHRDDTDVLTVAVADCGPGADPTELPLLTGKYYRGRLADGQPGAGLGLYLSRSFMTQMGGTLTCTNANPGLCVTLTLSLA
ncbi:MAG: ATP-binding protein [Micrococcales bacterium]|nr:ATP-binding protein [Micrococcales bacterium]MCL2667422.1 ATP-binding protein [Micrococcales bacterium]